MQHHLLKSIWKPNPPLSGSQPAGFIFLTYLLRHNYFKLLIFFFKLLGNNSVCVFIKLTSATIKSTKSTINGSCGPFGIPVRTYRFNRKEGV